VGGLRDRRVDRGIGRGGDRDEVRRVRGDDRVDGVVDGRVHHRGAAGERPGGAAAAADDVEQDVVPAKDGVGGHGALL
jgi:hypothetical protein